MFEYAPPFVADEARRIRGVHGGPATAVIIVATVVGAQRSHIFEASELFVEYLQFLDQSFTITPCRTA